MIMLRLLATTARVTGRLLSGLLALAVLAIALVGLPWLLIGWIGWPLPDHIPSFDEISTLFQIDMTDARVFNIVAVVGWIVWLWFVRDLVIEIIEACIDVAERRAGRPRAPRTGGGPVRVLAAVLVGAIAGAVLIDLARATVTSTPPSSGTAFAARPAVVATATHTAPTTDRAFTAPQEAAPAATQAQTAGPLAADGTYLVCEGDNLSTIAAAHLGDANLWRDIYTANRDVPQANGGALTDPDVIQPGWRLTIPAVPTAAAPAAPQTAPAPPVAAEHAPTAAIPAPPPATPQVAVTPQAVSQADGVVVLPSPSDTPSAASTAEHPDQQAQATAGVDLPSGSWISLGLAAAVAAASGLIWRHRRRRYRPRPPQPEIRHDDPDLQPLPATVNHIARRARPVQAVLPAETAAAAGAAVVAVAEVAWPTAGIALTGPGAEPAARGLLAALLGSGFGEPPEYRSRVITTTATLDWLLGPLAADLPVNPRLVVAADLDIALTWCEEEALARTRLLAEYDTDTVADVRAEDPLADPVPQILFLTDTTGSHAPRLAALLAQGTVLDIGGLILDVWSEGHTVTVSADGTTGEDARAAGLPGRLDILTAAETADLLTVFTEAHTGEPVHHPTSAPAPHDAKKVEVLPHPVALDADEVADLAAEVFQEPQDETTSVAPIPADDQKPATPAEHDAPVLTDDQRPLAAGDSDLAASDVPADEVDDGSEIVEEDNAPAASGSKIVAASRIRPVTLRILGRPEFLDGDEGHLVLRSRARELLVYLAVLKPGTGAFRKTVITDILADVSMKKAPNRLYTDTNNLHGYLVQSYGDQNYLSRMRNIMGLEPEAFHIDLWDMRAAILESRTAPSPAAKIAALQRAVGAYHGPLAEDLDYEWIGPIREGVRQQALDAHLQLAAMLTAGHPAEALVVLEKAIEHDPDGEAAYQQAMRAHAVLGDGEAIRDVKRRLTAALAEINADISEDTETLAAELLRDLRRKPRSNER